MGTCWVNPVPRAAVLFPLGKDFRWRWCQCPVLEVFDYSVSSWYPETCPAMCRSARLSHGCQDTRAESTGLVLGTSCVGSWELGPACPDAGAGFMAWVQDCAKAAIQLRDQAAKPAKWLYCITWTASEKATVGTAVRTVWSLSYKPPVHGVVLWVVSADTSGLVWHTSCAWACPYSGGRLSQVTSSSGISV